MTDQQLYLMAGVPTLVTLVGILINVGYFVSIINRLTSMENRLIARFDRLDMKLDLPASKIDVDNRLGGLSLG
ncbi:MAG: hypothetical protein IT168_27435 [Bryobacterales bacterium]|nr:hypothetical protein [Bryobacterales bacterium]